MPKPLDHQLLDGAARIAKIDIVRIAAVHPPVLYCYEPTGICTWTPFDDDGQANELADKIDARIVREGDAISVSADGMLHVERQVENVELPATRRRAIVTLAFMLYDRQRQETGVIPKLGRLED